MIVILTFFVTSFRYLELFQILVRNEIRFYPLMPRSKTFVKQFIKVNYQKKLFHTIKLYFFLENHRKMVISFYTEKIPKLVSYQQTMLLFQMAIGRLKYKMESFLNVGSQYIHSIKINFFFTLLMNRIPQWKYLKK